MADSTDVDRRRLEALAGIDLLDGAPEQAYQDAVTLAAAICGTPMAAVTLLDDHRQWFVAQLGLGLNHTPIDWSFCRLTIARDDPLLEVGDAADDPRLRDNPYVVGSPGIRFYAGAPLVLDDGVAVGALCVLDTQAGQLAPSQRDALQAVARQVASLLQARRVAQNLRQMTHARDEAAREAFQAATQLRAVFDGVEASSILTSPRGVILLASRRLSNLVSAGSDQTWVGRHYVDLVAADYRADEQAVMAGLWNEETPSTIRETTLIRDDGTELVVLAHSSLVRDAAGAPDSILTQLESISDRRKAEVALRESQSALDGIVTVDANQRIVSWNEGAQRVLGHSRLSAIGKPLSLIVPMDMRARHREGVDRLRAGAAPVLLGKTLELDALHADGSTVPIELSLSRWYRGGEPYYTGVIRDISERRRTLAQQQWRDQHDPVSKLGNLEAMRSWWRDTRNASSDESPNVAVFSLSLVGLSDISTALGISAVDRLLTEVGDVLRDFQDQSTQVFHLGDANFAGAILHKGEVNLRAQLEQRARALLGCLAQPLWIDDLPIQVDARIAIVGGQPHDTTLEELLRHTEALKQSSPRRVAVELAADVQRSYITKSDLRLLGELQVAVTSQQLLAYYQPLVPVVRPQELRVPTTSPHQGTLGAPHVVEALVRWQHPTRGLIPPAEFMPLAECRPLVTPITRWMLQAALTQQRRWAADGLDVLVAVNFSAEVLLNDDVVSMVDEALAATGGTAERLKIEITESAIVAEPHSARHVVVELRRRGISVSLDDFGTGYTSLNILRALPIDEIKLDRVFVTNIRTNPVDAAIAHAVVDLAHRMGVSAVAEGVEDQATSQILQELGYDYIQGYLHAQPLPIDQATEWLTRRAFGAMKTDSASLKDRGQITA